VIASSPSSVRVTPTPSMRSSRSSAASVGDVPVATVRSWSLERATRRRVLSSTEMTQLGGTFCCRTICTKRSGLTAAVST
jgi:hypothetical protein